MSAPIRLHRYRSLLALVASGLCLVLALANWPPPVRALDDEIGSTEYLYNTQSDFARGTFERTALSAAGVLAPDQAGAIELAPVGALNRENWSGGPALPIPLSDAPVVTLGRYLFVVGGATSGVGGGESRSNLVYRAEVDQATGGLVVNSSGPYPNGNPQFWGFEMPSVSPGIPGCNTPISPRSRSSAVAVPATSGTNLGYIFIIGGSVLETGDNRCRTSDFSISAVQRATVSTSGVITGWSAPNNWRFPSVDPISGSITNDPADLRGVQNLQVAFVRTSTGKNFIYAIGGLSVDPDQYVREWTYQFVFYTQVDANGNLVHPDDPSNLNPPTVWKQLDSLPLSGNGLHSGTAIAVQATRIEGGTPVEKDAIFLLGGCTDFDCTTLNTAVWRADVNPNTGALTWTNQVAKTSSGGAQPVNIQGRRGVTGLSFNNRLYYVTGSTATGPSGAAGATATIPVAIYDENFLLEDLTESNTYFVGLNETSDFVLPGAAKRLNASVALMPAVNSGSTNAAWMFVVGGSNTSNQPTDTVFVGGVGGANESTSLIRAPEGWYYSQPFTVLTAGETSRLLAFKWLTGIDRPTTNPEADIQLQFRATVTSGTCSESDFNPSTSSTNPARWRDLDGNPDPLLRSLNGLNEVRLINAFPDEEIQATCMQFRARFIQDAGNRTLSPKLYYFAVEKVVAAKPDLLIDVFNVQTVNSRFSTIELRLRNLRNNSLAATRSVEAASGGGSFFVDLCIARRSDSSTPALTAVPAPDPNASASSAPACATVSAQVPKSAMTPGATYTVALSAWQDAQTGAPANWDSIFGTPGVYDIGIVVDYNAFAGEDAQGRSNNRGENVNPPNGIIRTITIAASQNNIFVPVVLR
ncbi:MAG: hypothetical protein K6356_16140 [Chloroflexus sp.]